MPNVPQHTLDLLFAALNKLQSDVQSINLRFETAINLINSNFKEIETGFNKISTPAIPAAPVKAKRNFRAKPRKGARRVHS